MLVSSSLRAISLSAIRTAVDHDDPYGSNETGEGTTDIQVAHVADVPY